MALEYAMRGYLTDKAHVYSFGVILLEVISGRANTSMETKDDCFYLLDWANSLKEKGTLMELVDSRIEPSLNKEEAMTAINVALHCTNIVASERPSMSGVVSMLEGTTGVQHFVSEKHVPTEKTREHEEEGSMDVPWTASTAASADLYPLNIDPVSIPGGCILL